jgi:transposase InsO family protein
VSRFIDSQRARYGIAHATTCRALGVSQSWFYKWRHGDPSPRHARRKALTADIGRLFAVHKGKYGSPRIYADLRDEGWSISVNTVAAIMREQGMVARPKRHRRHTTRPGKGRWRAPDLVKRKFAAQQLNGKWYGDGTEVDTDEGNAKTFRAACRRCEIRQSMGRPGSALDNAVIESWHSTLEFELRMLEHFDTKAQARRELVAWIEDYNADRRHSALNMRSPLQHEQQLRDGGSEPGQAP